LADLLQRRAERLHQLVRQVADEADRVRQGVDAAVRGPRPADRRVEGGEERVLDEHARAGEPGEDRRLSRVGVNGDRHARHPVTASHRALGVADGAHVADLALEPGNARTDAPAVCLDLGFTRTTQTDATTCAAAATATTGLPGQRLAPATQARQEVL